MPPSPAAPSPTDHPMTPAERRAARPAPSPDEMDAIREEMRRDSELMNELIAKYGHPFRDTNVWSGEWDGDTDAA